MENRAEMPITPQPDRSIVHHVINKLRKEPQTSEQRRNQEIFDQQFDTRTTYEFDGGEVNTVHIKPEHPEGNPVIYGFGWMGMIDGCKPYLNAMFDGKKETFAFDQITTPPTELEEKRPYSKYTERNSDAIVEIAKQNGLKRVDLLLHSEGFSNGIAAIEKLMEHGIVVEEVVGINPTGAGNPSEAAASNDEPPKDYEALQKKKASKLQRAAIKMLGRELVRVIGNPRLLPDFIKLNYEGAKSMRKHPHLKDEGRAVSQTQMVELMKPLIERVVKFSILQATGDPFVNINDVNGDVQVIAQAVRKARVEVAREEVDRELGQDGAPIDAKKRLDLFEQKVGQIKRNEETEMLVTSATGNPGHLFNGYESTYIPHAVDILNTMRTRRTLQTISSQVASIPETTQQAA